MPFSRCSSNERSLGTFEKLLFKKKRIRSRCEYYRHKYSFYSEIHVFMCSFGVLSLRVFSTSILCMELNGLQIISLPNDMIIIAVEKDVFVAQKHA